MTAFPRRAEQLLNAPEHSPVGRVRQLYVWPGMSGLQNITIEVLYHLRLMLIWAFGHNANPFYITLIKNLGQVWRGSQKSDRIDDV